MNRINSDKLANYAVVFIALTAVFISIWQGRLMQKHNELTVRPYFNFTKNWETTNDTKSFSLELANQGYGPAIFQDYYIEANGQKFDNWEAALRTYGLDTLITRSSIYTKGDVYASNQKQIVLRLVNYTPEMSKDIELRIVYQSIYEEEFEISTTL